MIKEYKNLIITIGVILALVGIYSGYQKYQTQKATLELQKQELAKAQQEKESKLEEERKNQDSEVAKLKEDLETLKNQKPKTQTIIKEVPAPTPEAPPAGISLQAVIKQWEPMVAYVECQFRYTDGTIYQEQSGSGMLYIYYRDSIPDFSVLTNKHVAIDDNGYGAYACSIQFPNYNNDKVITVLNDNTVRTFSTPRNDADALFIGINNPDSYITNMKDGKYCQTTPNLGDQVVILGFPAIGSPTGVTVTKGIVSGYEGDYIITDAKIDHGNSGGVAINFDDNCYLGLPTWAATGEIESLARILKWQGIHN